MKNIKMKLLSHKIAIAIIGVLAIGFGVYAYNNEIAPKINLESGAVLNYNEAQTPITEVAKDLGAMPGSELFTDYFTVNGLTKFYDSKVLTKSTTTPCSIKSPNATSTLEFAVVNFKTSTTTDVVVTMAKSTSAFATTTIIGSAQTITANTQATLIASTTPLGMAAGTTTFAPNEYFVIGIQGGTYTSNPYSPVGKCQAVFIKSE